MAQSSICFLKSLVLDQEKIRLVDGWMMSVVWVCALQSCQCFDIVVWVTGRASGLQELLRLSSHVLGLSPHGVALFWGGVLLVMW